MKIAFKTIANYLLNFVALIIPLLLFIPNVVVQLIISSKHKSSVYKASKMAFKDALAIDIAFNQIYAEFWRNTMIKKGATNIYPFGKNGETLSFAIKNNLSILSVFGTIIKYIVIIADITTWLKGGHFKNTTK